MNRKVRMTFLTLILFPWSCAVFAQTEGGVLSPDSGFFGGEVITSVPYQIPQGGMPAQGNALPIQGNTAPIQGNAVPIQGNAFPGMGTPVPMGTPNGQPIGGFPDGGFSGAPIPFDSPLLSQESNNLQPYGPNNPPPVLNVNRRSKRDDGRIEPHEVPDTPALLDSLSKLLDIWSPETVQLDTIVPATAVKMTVPFGIDTQFLCRTSQSPSVVPANGRVQPGTEPAYAVGILCWNLPIGGKRIFCSAPNEVISRIGYGYQQSRGELLAALALANVASSYEIRAIPETQMTVKDLAASEMKEMNTGEDLSLLTVGLSFYLDNVEQTWTDAAGKTVSLLDLAELELNRPVYWNRSESINRLLGLTTVSARFHREIDQGNTNPRLRELTDKIDEYLRKIHRRALTGINDAGLHETRFLTDEKIHSATEFLLVNGHILRWQLSASDRFPINTQTMRKSIYHLALTLAQFYNPKTDKLGNISPKDVEAVSVSLHAIRLYIKSQTKGDSNGTQDNETALE